MKKIAEILNEEAVSIEKKQQEEVWVAYAESLLKKLMSYAANRVALIDKARNPGYTKDFLEWCGFEVTEEEDNKFTIRW